LFDGSDYCLSTIGVSLIVVSGKVASEFSSIVLQVVVFFDGNVTPVGNFNFTDEFGDSQKSLVAEKVDCEGFGGKAGDVSVRTIGDLLSTSFDWRNVGVGFDFGRTSFNSGGLREDFVGREKVDRVGVTKVLVFILSYLGGVGFKTVSEN